MLDEVRDILGSVDTDHPHLPQTALYNEGWLLRLVLAAMKKHGSTYPFRFNPTSRWYSEALLNSAFLTSAGRLSNSLAESHTHADGVVGQFEFPPQARTRLKLKDDVKQFVVREAKLFSLLGEGVTNARGFNQAARNVACMAETLRPHFPNNLPPDLDVGFYVIAPREQIDKGVFDAKMTRVSIEAAVADRILDYEHLDPGRYADLRDWERDRLKPLVDLLDKNLALKCVTWESVIQAIPNKDVRSQLQAFYEKCREVNQPASNQATPSIGGRPVSGGYYQIDKGGVPVAVHVIRVGSHNSRVERCDGVGPSFKVPNGTLAPIEDLAVPVGGGQVRRLRKGGLYQWAERNGTITRVRVANLGLANSRVRCEGDEDGESFLVPNDTLIEIVGG